MALSSMQISAPRLPRLYLPLSLSALAVSLAAWLAPSPEFNVLAIYISTLVSVYFVIRDGLLVWRGAGILGRATLNFGVFFWFWLEAFTQIHLPEPFRSAPLYPYFFRQIPTEVVATGVLCVNFFAVAMLWGWKRLPVPKKWISRNVFRLDPPSRAGVDVVVLAMACLYWAPTFVVFGNDFGGALSGLLEMRAGRAVSAEYGAGLFLHLRWVGMFGGAIAVARIVLSQPGLKLLQYLAAGVVVVGAFLSSSRYTLGFIMLPAMLMLLSGTESSQMKIVQKRMTFVTVLGLFGLVFLVQGVVRTTGVTTYISEEKGGVQEMLQKGASEGLFGHEHFSAMTYAIGIVPEYHDYFLEPMIPYLFTHFIPRQFWPGGNKPYSKAWLHYNATVTQGHTFNVTPSVTGQYYMNWSFPGVFFVGLLFGWFGRIGEVWLGQLDVRSQIFSATVGGMWIAFIFLAFRHFSPLYFQYPVIAYVVYRLVSRRAPSFYRQPCSRN